MNYNDGKWHGWGGGECPVHPESVVECLLECGHTGEMPAGWWTVWKTEVAAFRVIKEHKESREFWIVKVAGEFPEVHGHKPNYHDGIDVTHVREVIE